MRSVGEPHSHFTMVYGIYIYITIVFMGVMKQFIAFGGPTLYDMDMLMNNSNTCPYAELEKDSKRWSSSVYCVDRCVSLRQKALSPVRCSDMPSRGISVDYPSHGLKPPKVIVNCKRLPQGTRWCPPPVIGWFIIPLSMDVSTKSPS